MSTAEVAHHLGFSTRTITGLATSWVESGGTEGIPAFKIGKRQWRFDPERIEEWVRLRYPGVYSSFGNKLCA